MLNLNNTLLEDILNEVRPLLGTGNVADYIPALAEVNNQQLAIAIYTCDGQHFQAGDASTRFSIQSISKVLSLTLAMTRYSHQELWQRVGKDPSGQPFNSLVQLEMEKGIPRNPFINAGALVICDMLHSRITTPRHRMLELVRMLTDEPTIDYDRQVASSEYEHSARNAAIAWLMKSFGNFHNDVSQVLNNYFHYCSLSMNCIELARCFHYLASPQACSSVFGNEITARQVKHINALMMTSGMYNAAGEFAWRVGLPAKSGVGGGIVALVPGLMSIAVWSPELDQFGNSLAGTAILEKLTEKLEYSIF